MAEVALPCRASFELHPAMNQQGILSWGSCGAVAERLFLWQREGDHPHTSVNQVSLFYHPACVWLLNQLGETDFYKQGLDLF